MEDLTGERPWEKKPRRGGRRRIEGKNPWPSGRNFSGEKRREEKRFPPGVEREN